MKASTRVIFAAIAIIVANPAVNAADPIELSCDLITSRVDDREETRIDEEIYVTIRQLGQEDVRVELYRVDVASTTLLEGTMTDTEVNAIRKGSSVDRVLGGTSEVTIMINRESGDIIVISSRETDGEKHVIFKYGKCKTAIRCSNVLDMCDGR